MWRIYRHETYFGETRDVKCVGCLFETYDAAQQVADLFGRFIPGYAWEVREEDSDFE